jgi:hypothetical protein
VRSRSKTRPVPREAVRLLAEQSLDWLIKRVKELGFSSGQIGQIVGELTGREKPYTKRWVNKRLEQLRRAAEHAAGGGAGRSARHAYRLKRR